MSTTFARESGWGFAAPPERLPPPILGIRGLRYAGEGCPGLLPALAGLRVAAIGVVGARTSFDPLTGQTCFAELPAGRRRILVTDPEQRVLPVALELDIPGRLPARPTLGRAAPPGELPRTSVLLRPHPARAVPAGVTAVIGTVRDAAGRGVPLARLALAGSGGPEIVTFTAADGAFVLLLPEGAEPRRRLAVARPVERLAQALAADFLAGLPAGLDGTPPPELFRPVAAALLAADGSPAGHPAGELPLRAGRTARWDLRLAD